MISNLFSPFQSLHHDFELFSRGEKPSEVKTIHAHFSALSQAHFNFRRVFFVTEKLVPFQGQVAVGFGWRDLVNCGLNQKGKFEFLDFAFGHRNSKWLSKH